jgi:hypothetical protein
MREAQVFVSKDIQAREVIIEGVQFCEGEEGLVQDRGIEEAEVCDINKD